MKKYGLPEDLIDDLAWYAANALDYMVPDVMPSRSFAVRCASDSAALKDKLRRLMPYLNSEKVDLLDHVNEQINDSE
jgi:hypothetical protein